MGSDAGSELDDVCAPTCAVCKEQIHDSNNRKRMDGQWFHKFHCGTGSIWFDRLAARSGDKDAVTKFRTENPKLYEYMLFDMLEGCKKEQEGGKRGRLAR